MLKKDITYTDFNDVKRTESFYFNLSETEVLDVGTGEHGTSGVSMYDQMQALSVNQDISGSIRIIKDLILLAYGVKSDDGRRFIKNAQLREEFSQTQAFVELFLELGGDANVAAAFFEGLMPKDLAARAQKLQSSGKTPEQIRADSMAQMQGFRKPAEPEVHTMYEEPLPAAPVNSFRDPSEMTQEEKDEMIRRLQA